MNLLGIDFGTRRAGLAWVDTDIGVVMPFGLISGKNLAEISEKLVQTIEQEKPDKIVFGLPLTLKNTEGEEVKRVKSFVQDLKEKISTPIEYFDERFSSQLADRFSGEASRDEKAAVLILEDYLNKK